jgi:hypothetical protein
MRDSGLGQLVEPGVDELELRVDGGHQRQLDVEAAAPQVVARRAVLDRPGVSRALGEAGPGPLLVPARERQALLVVDRADRVAAPGAAVDGRSGG